MAFFFEVSNASTTPLPPHKRRYFQFLTTYQAATGRTRLRVTTVCGLWHSDPNDTVSLGKSFDQEAAAVLMSRLSVHRAETEEGNYFIFL